MYSSIIWEGVLLYVALIFFGGEASGSVFLTFENPRRN